MSTLIITELQEEKRSLLGLLELRATPEVKDQLDPALWVRLVPLSGTFIGLPEVCEIKTFSSSNASTRVFI